MFGAGLVKKMEPTGVSSGPVSLQQIGVFIRKVLQNNFFIPPCEVYKFISTSTNLNIVLHPYFWADMIDENWFPVSVFVPFLLANLWDEGWFAKYIFWHDRERDSETAVWLVWTVWVGWLGQAPPLYYISLSHIGEIQETAVGRTNIGTLRHFLYLTIQLRKQRLSQTMRKKSSHICKVHIVASIIRTF